MSTTRTVQAYTSTEDEQPLLGTVSQIPIKFFHVPAKTKPQQRSCQGNSTEQAKFRDKRKTHQRLDGVSHPERHEKVFAVSAEVVRVVKYTEVCLFLDNSRDAVRVVEATQTGFST